MSTNDKTYSPDAELMRVIGRIEGKIDGMVASHAGLHVEYKELRVDYERLRSKIQAVENRMWMWAGGITVLSPIAYMLLKPMIERAL